MYLDAEGRRIRFFFSHTHAPNMSLRSSRVLNSGILLYSKRSPKPICLQEKSHVLWGYSEFGRCLHLSPHFRQPRLYQQTFPQERTGVPSCKEMNTSIPLSPLCGSWKADRHVLRLVLVMTGRIPPMSCLGDMNNNFSIFFRLHSQGFKDHFLPLLWLPLSLLFDMRERFLMVLSRQA